MKDSNDSERVRPRQRKKELREHFLLWFIMVTTIVQRTNSKRAKPMTEYGKILGKIFGKKVKHVCSSFSQSFSQLFGIL
jgi:hypothetical protein